MNKRRGGPGRDEGGGQGVGEGEGGEGEGEAIAAGDARPKRKRKEIEVTAESTSEKTKSPPLPQTVSPHLAEGALAAKTLDLPEQHVGAPVLQLPAPPQAQKSHHSDNEDLTVSHHLIADVDQVIGGRFQIMAEMGTGTFGKVYRCRDFKHNDVVALKCIRSIGKYIDSAKVESKILNSIYKKQRDMLQSGGLDREYCVKMYTHVNHGPHYCMAFEPLGPSLLDVLKQNSFQGYPLSFVQHIGHQLCQALNFMAKIDLVHTDIKLENILFTSPDFLVFNDWTMLYDQEFFKRRYDVTTLHFPKSASIKIIDFGGANYMPNGKTKTSVVNTRQYRGPEVTLELGWTFPSDIWSVGCMLAEIWTGELLFPTHDNLEHLCMMEALIGPFPQWMKSRSPVRRNYFQANLQIRIEELSEHSRKKVSGLATLAAFQPNLGSHHGEHATKFPDVPGEGFLELLQGLLQLDPRERMLPRQAIENKFLSNIAPLPPGSTV